MDKNNLLLARIVIYLSFVLSIICMIWIVYQGYIAEVLEARLIPCSTVLGSSLIAIALVENK